MEWPPFIFSPPLLFTVNMTSTDDWTSLALISNSPQLEDIGNPTGHYRRSKIFIHTFIYPVISFIRFGAENYFTNVISALLNENYPEHDFYLFHLSAIATLPGPIYDNIPYRKYEYFKNIEKLADVLLQFLPRNQLGFILDPAACTPGPNCLTKITLQDLSIPFVLPNPSHPLKTIFGLNSNSPWPCEFSHFIDYLRRFSHLSLLPPFLSSTTRISPTSGSQSRQRSRRRRRMVAQSRRQRQRPLEWTRGYIRRLLLSAETNRNIEDILSSLPGLSLQEPRPSSQI